MSFKCRHCFEFNITSEEDYLENYELCFDCFEYVEEEITKSFYANKYENPDFSYEFDEWFIINIQNYYLDYTIEYSDSDADSENAY
jgi:hypothetical protein